MPGYYKWPAYVGNVLLALCGLIIFARNSALAGFLVTALAGLNIFLVRKLDIFSREEVWLELEIKKAKMREELLDIERKLAEANGSAAPAEPRQISGPKT